MLGIWFLRIKSIFSQILAFTIAHWHVILPLLILGYCLLNWHFAVKRADKAELALNTFKTEIQRATDAQRLQNEYKKIQGENESKAIELEHKQALKRLGLAETTTAKLKKELQNEKQNLINALNNAYELRVNSASNTFRLPKVSESPEVSTESGGVSNTTLARTVRACQDTTISYNSLWESWHKNCLIYGCAE